MAPSSFPFDTTEFRIGAFQIPALRRWYERERRRKSLSRVFWPGFFLCFDLHVHLATYAVDDLPWWPATLVREQPTGQIAIRTPWFCLVLAYCAMDWGQMFSFSWRSEIVLHYAHRPGWWFEEGDAMFDKEWRRKFSEWFMRERPVPLENGGWTKEIKFERVY